MHRDRSAPAHVLLVAAALLAACGTEKAGTTPSIGIEFSEQALLDRASVVAIYFYQAGTACADLRAAVPRPQSVLGPYQAALDDQGRERGIVFSINEVPAGEYVVFVDALDANGANVGSGCAAGQRIFDRQVSRIRVVISDG